VKDQPSTSGSSNEPNPRPKTIPDDFIWDAESESWYPPGEPSTYDAAAWLREFQEARRRGDFGGGGLISADELRAAGALQARPTRRRSRRVERVERDLFSDLPDDNPPPAPPDDRDGDKSADESQ
jgi:hypothetical protein